MKSIAIIDYKLGNLFSVRQACLHFGANAIVTSNKIDLEKADAIILPGVGAFAEAMTNLKTLDLIDSIKKFVESGKPFMGVCLGQQLLFTESEEFINTKGLNLIEGTIKKFPISLPDNDKAKVPQVAWNTVHKANINWDSTPLNGLEDNDFQYFVHSYYTEPINSEIILTTTSYEGFNYCSSILKDNIFACQFHPEKSGEKGLLIYKNWINNIK